MARAFAPHAASAYEGAGTPPPPRSGVRHSLRSEHIE